MAEEGYESKFVCKLCFKKFGCGKSLGGHMRSHVVANSAEFHDFNSKNGEFVNEQSGYGLRENPKKTWRAVDFRPPLSQDSVCRQCGKGFATRKALSGHMASHSSKDKSNDHSWTSEDHKIVVSDNDSESDSEEIRRLRRRSRVCDDESPILVVNCGSSSLSDHVDGQEQEEVAMCLMMLSRDFANVNSVVESSDNNSVVMETKSCSTELRNGRLSNECRKLKDKDSVLDDKTAKMEDSDSAYFLDECAKAESDVSVDWFRRNRGFEGRNSEVKMSLKHSRNENGKFESRKREVSYENNPQKKSKYECFNCKKVFKSYQALGGHRPCHKRSYESRDGSGENSQDDSPYYKTSSAKNLSKKSKAKKNKGHVCPFCNRVFKNGQALGGHKRSHFIGGHDENRRLVVKPDSPDLLDLNLPAPEATEDDGSGRVFSW